MSKCVLITLNVYHWLHHDGTSIEQNLHNFAQIEVQYNEQGRESQPTYVSVNTKLEVDLFWNL